MSEALWPLFRAVHTDEEAAWQALAAAVHPVLRRFAATQPVGRLRGDADVIDEVCTRVLERLHARSFAAIHKLCTADPPPPLEAWLRVLVRNATIDTVRAMPEFERATSRRDARWITLATLVSTPGAAPDSLAEKRHAVLQFLDSAVARATALAKSPIDEALATLASEWSISRTHARRLVQRGTRYVPVIRAVLAGHSYAEVAAQLELTRREVELIVEYVEEFLAARRFAMD